MNYLNLPKVDLHCHLDGSVRLDTIKELAKEEGIVIPKSDDVLRDLLVAPMDCESLDDYLKCFSLPVQLMQKSKQLERITYELFEDAARENIKYLEVRFGPLLHLECGLSLDEVYESVITGMRKAEAEYDIKGNIIVSILRTMSKDRIYEVIDKAQPYLNKGIVAIDLAASELKGFCKDFVPYIEYARNMGFEVTIHAGETGYGENVLDAVELLKATRIGHGIYIHNHEEAYEIVHSKKVGLEMCPTSNVQTKAVKTYSEHSLYDFYKDDIQVTINTDNRTVSDTTMTKEIEKIFEVFDLTLEDYKQIYMYSVMQSFASVKVKNKLINDFV